MNFKNTKHLKENNAKDLHELEQKFDEQYSSADENAKQKDEKKNFTISLSVKTMRDLEAYLKEFGIFNENKSSFIQEAIEEHLKRKKSTLKERLSELIKKL
ncbi:hypothetical protein [Helicobacter cetorum]|uniref:Ribbon-helix-helix protein CopG domain-containing protein n=1 Tax=Helicobacter cetorum (strain ATCC BAA-540 / CCUG 52418 / MIT 99-5656) TaxID=1163745 RepID=I0EUN9_HELCM|nr:hypothetical protein [Helicobacter cetorum]AFI06658.1 hypothetical protein HCD_08380 [Helicobacter cetorum MIT 99-5656]